MPARGSAAQREDRTFRWRSDRPCDNRRKSLAWFYRSAPCSEWGLSGGLAQEKVKFPVGVGTKTIGTNMFWLATKKAFFDDSGPEVQPVLLGGGTAINMQALVSESLYLALGSADATIGAAASGADLFFGGRRGGDGFDPGDRRRKKVPELQRPARHDHRRAIARFGRDDHAQAHF